MDMDTKKENCRGKSSCCKCGGRDHEYSNCPNAEKRCVNCKGNHSAAYGGCTIYKQEAKIQIIKERSNVSYSQAKEMLSTQAPLQSVIHSKNASLQRTYSQTVQSNIHSAPENVPPTSRLQHQYLPCQKSYDREAIAENPQQLQRTSSP